MPTEIDICTPQAIVSCHETFPPTPRPRHAQLAVMRDGPSKSLQVTFGAHQSTDRSDSLDAIIKRYRTLAQERHGDAWRHATLADELEGYLPALAENTAASCARLARDHRFLGLLVESAGDPLMRLAQDQVFNEKYMAPALQIMESMGWVEPLTLAVLYDSKIHGSYGAVRDKTMSNANERIWIPSYVATRHFHLGHAGERVSVFGNRLLRSTVYRMKTFETLLAENNWGLETPITTGNGARIEAADVEAWRTAA